MPLVSENRRALASEAAAVLGHEPDTVEELAHGRKLTLTESVHRVGTATASAVVKVVASPRSDARIGSSEPSHPWYWLREPVLYESGLPRAYRDAQIATPTLLARVDRGDGSIALWLEDLQGLPGASWSVANYATASLRLGRAQGPSLLGGDEDDPLPWSRGFLPGYFAQWDEVGWDRVLDDEAWTTDLIRAHFPTRLREDLVRLCAQRNVLIGWSSLLPSVISHHDLWLNNAFELGDRTALIDWAFAGHGHLGTDIGNLVSDSCGDLLQPTAALPDFDAAATAAYREGLRDAGWAGDFRLARLGMCLMAAKWSWLVPWMLQRAIEDHHQVYGGTPVDSDYLFSERAAMLEFYTEWATEAVVLADQLGFPPP